MTGVKSRRYTNTKMIGKKINQLATELAPLPTDLTIIGDPTTGVSKKITLEQISSLFGGSVSFYTNLAGFPAVGNIDIIYCAKDTNKLYLWSGSAYVEMFPSQALLDTYQLRSEKGNANGYASLDSLGKVPISQLPSSLMEYKGMWNAATNTPTLANGTGDTGDVYICNVAGTVNFGAGPITFAVGDYVIYSGTIWQRSSGAVGTVTSVAASITGNSIGITGSPITTSGTLALAFSGTSAQYINGAGNLTTFPTSLISGSGASGQVTFFNGANSVTGTNNFFWDATNNRLGIGTTTPQRSIEIYNTTADNHLRLSGNAPSVSMGEAVTGSIYQAKFGLVTTNGQFVSAGVAGDFVIISQTGATIIGTSSTEKMRVNTSGNVSINNTNDTYKLDVNGTVRFTGQLRLESTITDGTNTYTLPSATGTLALTSQIPSVTGYVPYTGATANLDLGTHTLIAAKGTFSSSGSGDTVGITHSSGSGIALNITKGGAGEGLYINKTSGSGNAATIIGTLNATTLVKSGGTSSQFLKADGSVDSTSYGTGSVTSVGLFSATSGVTIGSTPITTSGTITLAIATASGSQQGLLSSTDWTTFNNKQNALTNPVTGTGTTNYLPKFTGASTIGDSAIVDNTLNVTIAKGNAANDVGLQVQQTSNFTAAYINITANNDGGAIYNAIRSNTNGGTTHWQIDGGAAVSNLVIRTGGTERLRINASGNLGLGVTPSAWSLGTALEIANGAAILGFSNETFIANNAYFNGGWKYRANATAQAYFMNGGEHKWQIAPSGTAGNAISFTQAMTLNASGNLSIGNTNNTYKLDVTGQIRVNGSTNEQLIVDYTTASGGFTWQSFRINGANKYRFFGNTDNSFALYSDTAATQVLTIASTGAATFSSSVTSTLSSGIFLNNSSGGTNATQIRINNTGGDARMGIESSTGGTIQIGTSAYSAVFGNQANAATEFTTNGTVRMTITSGGNVGIGTTSPTYNLEVWTASSASLQNALNVTNGANADFTVRIKTSETWIGPTTATPLIFANSSNTERMRITSGGALLVGTTSSGNGIANRGLITVNGSSTSMYELQVGGTEKGYVYHSGTDLYLNNSVNGGRLYCIANNSGVYLTTGATSWTANSDERLKADLVPIDNALNKISELRAVVGRYKTDLVGTRRSFLIAQDVLKVLPEAVDIDNDTMKTLGVRYTEVIPLLVASIKELKQELDTLKNK
jgi:hypothetical protein